ncbi:MAG: glycosyltransferase [Planctomyces sp.]
MCSIRIDFVAPPFAGHLYPLLDLACQLRERGFSNLRFLSTPEAETAVQLCGFDFVPLLEGRSHLVFEIADTQQRVGFHPGRLLGQLRMNLSLMNDFRSQLKSVWTESLPSLVIADFTVPIAGFLARSLGASWWTATPSPCAMETPDGPPSYLGGWMPRHDFQGRLRDALGRLTIRSFKNTVHWMFRDSLRQLGLEKMYRNDGYESIYSDATVLIAGVPDFEFATRWPTAALFIGPLTNSPPFPHHPPDFRNGRPRILVSLGTHLWWAKTSVCELMQRVAVMMPEVDFHFTLGKTPDRPALLNPGETTSNFTVLDYVNYDQWLPHYSAAVIHGGTGVTYSCLKHGIPTLVCPQDYDQFDHAARLVHRGLALRCRPRAEQIVADLKQLLTDTAIQSQCQKFREIIRRYSPGDIVARRIRERIQKE